METHLATTPPGTARAHQAPRLPATLPELATYLEAREALEDDDRVLPLRDLRMNPEGLLVPPGTHGYAFTPWSQQQLARILGIRWDRWFLLADPHERAEEVNRRLGRSDAVMRLRTARDSEGTNGASGVLRAFVSPGYAPVADSALARVLVELLPEGETEILRLDQTDRTVSYAVGLARFVPQDGMDAGDAFAAGFAVRNSGVGFASLKIVAFLHRLICKNGMHTPLADATLLHRVHRGQLGERVKTILTERLRTLPDELRDGVARLRATRAEPVAGAIDEAMRAFLAWAGLPQRLLPNLMAAYRLEPLPTVFGVVQAVTRAAQALTSELRFELEHAVGAYLTSTTGTAN